MKINSIEAKNFAGCVDLKVELENKVLLIHGFNSNGKSFSLSAIRSALIGKYEGILRKNYGLLVSHGNKNGFSSVSTDIGEYRFSLPSGVNHSPIDFPEYIKFCIETDLFLKLKRDEQKNIVFNMFGLSSDPDTVIKILLGKALNEKKLELIKPMLTDLENANEKIKERISDLRAEWKAITGEVYGSEKAEVWRPKEIKFDQKNFDEDKKNLEELKKNLEDWILHLGKLKSNKSEDEIKNLQVQADNFLRLKELCKTKKVTLRVQEENLNVAQRSYNEERSKSLTKYPLVCIKCGEKHHLIDGRLSAYNESDANNKDLLKEYEDSLNVTSAAYRAIKTEYEDLENKTAKAEAAANLLKSMNLSGDLSDPKEIKLAESKIDEIKKSINGCESIIRSQEKLKEEFERTKDSEVKAKAKHNSIKEWIEILHYVSPDGIKNQLLKDAIMQINERLKSSYDFFRGKSKKFPLPKFNENFDLEIFGDGYQYNSEGIIFQLCSKSDQWKIGVVISEAISHFSKMKILIIDEVDILAPSDRGSFFSWLKSIAAKEEIDTAICAMTAKERMEKSPNGIDVLWIEDGISNIVS